MTRVGLAPVGALLLACNAPVVSAPIAAPTQGAPQEEQAPSATPARVPAQPRAPAASTQDAPAPAPPVGDILRQVDAAYGQVQTFEADFTQRFHVKAYDQEKLSRGHGSFARPGKMNLVFSDPMGNRIVSDGVSLGIYEAANQQWFKSPVAGTQPPVMFSFLNGTTAFRQAFHFTPGPTSFAWGPVLLGVPLAPSPACVRVSFYVDGQTWDVRRVVAVDDHGNENRFDLTSPRKNVSVDPLQFVVP
jgi:outer membrane lipoprotein-sorting protein